MAQPGESLAKDLTPAEFERFRDYLHRHSGIYLEEQKADSLRISLVTRATRFGFLSLDEYYKHLSTDEAEFKALMNLVTINETSFFRFPAQFEALKKNIVPEIVDGKPEIQKSVRVWSAGCSTGEEPYTIAMTLLDSGLEGFGYTGEVLGTDVSTSALDRAREGVYPSRALLNVPHSISTRFFEPTANGHRVVDKVRAPVTFQYHNLIKEPFPLGLMGNWDIIFCRNVTIYFRLESTRRVIQNFYDALNPGGYLFVGHSETLTSISDHFDPVEVGGVFLYRKPHPRRPSFSAKLSDSSVSPTRSRTTTAQRRERLRSVPREVPAAESTSILQPANEELSATVLLAQAKEASAEGHAAQALSIAEEVLQAEPDNVQALLITAWARLDMGDLDGAFDDARAALEMDPLLATARYIVGMIYLRRDDVDGAVAEFKRTVYSDQGFVLAHLNLGNILKAQGSMSIACRHYENAVKAMYSNPEGDWTTFMGGFKQDLLAQTCERSLIECRKASGRD